VSDVTVVLLVVVIWTVASVAIAPLIGRLVRGVPPAEMETERE
jgi:hypothetical protein